MRLWFDRHQIPKIVAASELAWSDVMDVVILPTAPGSLVTAPIPFSDILAALRCSPWNPLSLRNHATNVTRKRNMPSGARVYDSWVLVEFSENPADR
jgi:hypothetical protein